MSSSDRRRRSNIRQYSAEDQALNQISKEAESRLAAKRAARAEARGIRHREIEKQQREAEKEQQEKVNDISGDITIRSAGRQDGSRRGSDDSTESSESKSDRNFKAELRELEEKYKKAMMTSAQLDNEKQTLIYQVELLKDQLEEQEESFTELNREYKDKTRELEMKKKAYKDIEHENACLKEQMAYKDRLIEESGLVIVSAGEDGKYVLQKSDSLPNGPVPTGNTALLNMETIEILQKAGEGSLGTDGIDCSDRSMHGNHNGQVAPSEQHVCESEPKVDSDAHESIFETGASNVSPVTAHDDALVDKKVTGGMSEQIVNDGCNEMHNISQNVNTEVNKDVNTEIQNVEESVNISEAVVTAETKPEILGDSLAFDLDGEGNMKGERSGDDSGISSPVGLPNIMVTDSTGSKISLQSCQSDEEGDEFFDAISATPSPYEKHKFYIPVNTEGDLGEVDVQEISETSEKVEEKAADENVFEDSSISLDVEKQCSENKEDSEYSESVSIQKDSEVDEEEARKLGMNDESSGLGSVVDESKVCSDVSSKLEIGNHESDKDLGVTKEDDKDIFEDSTTDTADVSDSDKADTHVSKSDKELSDTSNRDNDKSEALSEVNFESKADVEMSKSEDIDEQKVDSHSDIDQVTQNSNKEKVDTEKDDVCTESEISKQAEANIPEDQAEYKDSDSSKDLSKNTVQEEETVIKPMTVFVESPETEDAAVGVTLESNAKSSNDVVNSTDKNKTESQIDNTPALDETTKPEINTEKEKGEGICKDDKEVEESREKYSGNENTDTDKDNLNNAEITSEVNTVSEVKTSVEITESKELPAASNESVNKVAKLNDELKNDYDEKSNEEEVQNESKLESSVSEGISQENVEDDSKVENIENDGNAEDDSKVENIENDGNVEDDSKVGNIENDGNAEDDKKMDTNENALETPITQQLETSEVDEKNNGDKLDESKGENDTLGEDKPKVNLEVTSVIEKPESNVDAEAVKNVNAEVQDEQIREPKETSEPDKTEKNNEAEIQDECKEENNTNEDEAKENSRKAEENNERETENKSRAEDEAPEEKPEAIVASDDKDTNPNTEKEGSPSAASDDILDDDVYSFDDIDEVLEDDAHNKSNTEETKIKKVESISDNSQPEDNQAQEATGGQEDTKDEEDLESHLDSLSSEVKDSKEERSQQRKSKRFGKFFKNIFK